MTTPVNDAEIRRLVEAAEHLVTVGPEGTPFSPQARGGHGQVEVRTLPEAEAGGAEETGERSAVQSRTTRLGRRTREERNKPKQIADWTTQQGLDASGEEITTLSEGTTSGDEGSGETTSGCEDSSGAISDAEASPLTSGSEDFDCSVVTCREVVPPVRGTGDVIGAMETPPTSRLLGSPKSADNLAPSSSEPGGSGELPANQRRMTSRQLTSGPSHVSEPANGDTHRTSEWSGRRRARARRPMACASSGSEGGAPGSPIRRRRRAGRPAASKDNARPVELGTGTNSGDAAVDRQLSCATDTTLEEHSISDIADDVIDVVNDGSNDDVIVAANDGNDVAADDSFDAVSLISEQAWDPYLEYREISDLGSECAADPSTLLRMLDCDDYRAFLDSLSDCTSSPVSTLSRTHHRPPPRRQRRQQRPRSSATDSEADGFELTVELASSRGRLLAARAELETRASHRHPICGGIVTLCRSEEARMEQLLLCLDPLGLSASPDTSHLKPTALEALGVLQQWTALRREAEELQRSSDCMDRLQERVRSCRLRLAALDEKAARAGTDVATVAELQTRADDVQTVLRELADLRQEMTAISADAQQEMTEEEPAEQLRESVATLYRLWEEVHQRCQTRLQQLSAATDTWREFEEARVQLASALEQDRRRLSLLETVLSTGDAQPSDVVHTDVTDSGVSQLSGISEMTGADDSREEEERRKQRMLWAYLSGLSSVPADELSEATSGYESACSDELSERERRLGRLRRIAGDLETLLSPRGPAWSDIKQTLDSATSGLRELQQSCRHLVVMGSHHLRTEGAPDPTRQLLKGVTGPGPSVARRRSMSSVRREMAAPSRGRRGRLRRVLRAALPIQVALLLLLCVTCLLEPRCCDDVNNLAMSLTPQLRYLSGPPPI